LGRHVVEHDYIDASGFYGLFCLLDTAHLNLYLQLLSGGADIIFCEKDRLADPAGKLYMVILEHDHVEQPQPMVLSPTDPYGPFFRKAKVRRGLAGVYNGDSGVGDFLHKATCGSCNAAHALHAVQHKAFRCQNGSGLPVHNEGDIAPTDPCAVVEEDVDRKSGIKIMEDSQCECNSGKYAVFLYQELCGRRLFFPYTTEGRMVSLAHVLLQSLLNEPIQVFVGNIVRRHRAKIDRTGIL